MASSDEDAVPGIDAYHGTPHTVDRFDSKYIGTGEGATAYGHGLYFAENPEVANEYRVSLSREPSSVTFDGEPVATKTDPLISNSAAALLGSRGDVPAAIAAFRKSAKYYRTMNNAIVPGPGSGHADRESSAAKMDERAKFLEEHGHRFETKIPGNTYQVKIDAHPDHFLDWDGATRRDHPHAKALDDLYRNSRAAPIGQGIHHGGVTGEDIYRNLTNQLGSKGAASAALLKAGIPGIRYLDQGSRDHGEGTSNYVVFDDKMISIKRRYAEGGAVMDDAATKSALEIARGAFAKGGRLKPPAAPPPKLDPGISNTADPNRIIFHGTGSGGVRGINVPRHMWENSRGAKGTVVLGMKEKNKARADVYGPENRPPLTKGDITFIHSNTLRDHFGKSEKEQIAAEDAALARLRAAKALSKDANTLDKSEKLDTVNHEYDDQGRSYIARAQKGVAGHSLYTSGVGDKREFHIINTCAGQTAGCGGGVDSDGVTDTTRGSCFAPHAEAQYGGAASRRASQTQAKHDPAMTEDWILAHAGSLRAAAKAADRANKRFLFRPNVVDETDNTSRYAIQGLNRQRVAKGLPVMEANSYGKTNELHDPENGWHVTYSNVGPKVKLGASIKENITRDSSRVSQTIRAQNKAGGADFANEQGNKTPPKNSYMVTDVVRDTPLAVKMHKSFKYAKYWGVGRPVTSLSEQEAKEGKEGHYDGAGKPTTPDKAHYGHTTLNGKRFDYQKQHILPPRLVAVGKNDDGTPHVIPTDSRFKDNDFLPNNRYMSPNGKAAGAILMTTPTTSTSGVGHNTSFTHHVGPEHIEHALKNNGEYEIDAPALQEAAAGNEYVAPRGAHRAGGAAWRTPPADDVCEFPEQSFTAQAHNAHRGDGDEDPSAAAPRATGSPGAERALALTSPQNLAAVRAQTA